jgi:hypothetical protein
MKGFAFDFLAVLHAVTVIMFLIWIPFGKFFHIIQRPAQIGAHIYKKQGMKMGMASLSAYWRGVCYQITYSGFENRNGTIGFRFFARRRNIAFGFKSRRKKIPIGTSAFESEIGRRKFVWIISDVRN